MSMALSDRMRIIINECGLKQKAFAKSIDATDSYISKLLRDESGMSNRTAMVIEQLYGYSKDWIISGKEPKMQTGWGPNFTSLQKRIINAVEKMDEDQQRLLLDYIEFLKKSAKQQHRERKAN
jgi:plasmid maintenance system antidote protein VapI